MTLYRIKSGFTLFELIVAMAVTSVIAAFVFAFSSSLMKLWTRSQSAISTELDANIALDVIAMDLEAAVFLERGDVMFAVNVQDYDARNNSTAWKTGSVRLKTNDFDPGNHVYGWAGTWLRFFTAAPTLNAVAYQIIRREAFDGSNQKRYILYRSVVRQDYTQESGFDITDGSYASGVARQSQPKTIRKPTVADYLLEDVVDFGVRLYVYDTSVSGSANSSTGMRLIYPANIKGSLNKADDEHIASTGVGADYSIRYPDVVEIFIRVIDSVGAEKLRLIEEDGGEGTFEAVVAEHGRLYSRMVRVASSF